MLISLRQNNENTIRSKILDIAVKLAYNVGIFFLIMIPGIIMKKTHLSTDGLGKGLSNLVLYVAQPVLIFNSYLREFDKKVFINMLYVLVFSIIVHVIFSVIAMRSFKKSPPGDRRMLRFATIFSNAAFMGIPLIKEVIGAEAVIYASIYNITFNAFLWTLGVYICTVNKGNLQNYKDCDKEHIYYRKAFLHPTMIAAYIGLMFFFLPIHDDIPALLTDGLARIDVLVAPLSMVVLGLRLAELDLRGFFKDKGFYLFIFLRHLALPTIAFFIMRGLAVFIDIDPVVIKCVLIMASAPSATSATMFAEMYDCDAKYVSKIVAVSTILSLATMPLVSLLTLI